MVQYTITKYNPSKNHENEWTSISDIGNSKYNNPSYQEYEKVENAYVEAIKLILKEKGINNLTVDALEQKHFFEDFEDFDKNGRLKNIDVNFKNEITTLKNRKTLDLTEIQKFVRLILREIVWMNLISTNLKITFGYDYYMYAECDKLSDTTIQHIQEMGLFVKPNLF